jgi:hypothetical protein
MRALYAAGVLLLLATVQGPLAAQTTESAAQCPLDQYQVTSVQAHFPRHPAGKGTLEKLDGAELRVKAEPGLFPERLQLALMRSTAATKLISWPDCPFDVDGVRVKVESAEADFLVILTTTDPAAAREILDRARRRYAR